MLEIPEKQTGNSEEKFKAKVNEHNENICFTDQHLYLTAFYHGPINTNNINKSKLRIFVHQHIFTKDI